MSIVSLTHSVVDAIVADLEAADWQYDPEADDMDIILPNVVNRAAEWLDIEDDFFVRIDPGAQGAVEHRHYRVHRLAGGEAGARSSRSESAH